MLIPNNREKIAFVVAEPPEIEKFKIKFLKQFGVVFAPEFEYLKVLRDIQFVGGVLPWQAGYFFENNKTAKISFSRFWFNSVAYPCHISNNLLSDFDMFLDFFENKKTSKEF